MKHWLNKIFLLSFENEMESIWVLMYTIYDSIKEYETNLSTFILISGNELNSIRASVRVFSVITHNAFKRRKVQNMWESVKNVRPISLLSFYVVEVKLYLLSWSHKISLLSYYLLEMRLIPCKHSWQKVKCSRQYPDTIKVILSRPWDDII